MALLSVKAAGLVADTQGRFGRPAHQPHTSDRPIPVPGKMTDMIDLAMKTIEAGETGNKFEVEEVLICLHVVRAGSS